MSSPVLNIQFIVLISVAMLWAQPNFSMTGFATQNGGTTGGEGGQTVMVRSYADLKSHAESDGAKIILVEGTISNGSGGGQIRIRSNKSILGVGSNALLSGIGLNISSNNNIIIRNLSITLVGTTNPAGVNGGDAISINGTSRNIWIDHCRLFSEDPDVQTNLDKYDGLLDIRDQTGYITVSWNYFHDHHKGSLVGASDTDLFADRKVTFHHNYFRKIRLRVPMFRGSTGHFFNNYIVGARDASEIRVNACVRMERNYYESLRYSIYTPTDARGRTERISNIEISRTARAYPENCVASIPYNYSAVLTSSTEDVKSLVPQWAGVGKIQIGQPPSAVAEAVLIKRGSGSSRQSLIIGEAIVPFWYSWENANTVTTQGFPAGLIIAIDNASKSVTISGTPTAPVGAYNFTISTVGTGSVATMTGTIIIDGITAIYLKDADKFPVFKKSSGYDLVGRSK